MVHPVSMRAVRGVLWMISWSEQSCKCGVGSMVVVVGMGVFVIGC